MLLNSYIVFFILIFNIIYNNNLYIYGLCLVVYILVIFVFTKNFENYKNNEFENDFWFLIEILNNNNKSIFFFLIIVFFTIFFFNKCYITTIISYKNIYFFFIFFLFFFYFYNCNFQFKYYLIQPLLNNTKLINGIVLIHPILIYYVYSVFIFIILLLSKLSKTNFSINIVLNNKNKLSFFSFFGLFLGGYWAQQEINWGGWWNWDFVEIIALIFNVLSLYIIHTNFIKYNNSFIVLCRNIVYYLISFFIFVRVDVLNSIHSFNSFSITNNYKHLLMLFLIFNFFFFLKFIFFFLKKLRLRPI